jgi:hypothetical protein
MNGCWKEKLQRHKICGSEPGSARVCEIGICPVTPHEELENLTEATNADRAGWIALRRPGTQGSYTQKLAGCPRRDFYRNQEGEGRNDFPEVFPQRAW